MGYTTEFEGRFNMDKLPPAEVIVRLRELEGIDGREDSDPDMPGGYNQWNLTKDCQGIEWDGSEKFYDYVEWLQYLIDKVLAPAGVTLSGTIAYSGEDVKDAGILTIQDGKVEQIERALVGDALEELRQFKEYVLASRYGSEIAAGWRQHQAVERG